MLLSSILMKEAAIFDVDKTILAGNTGKSCSWFLFRKGLIKFHQVIKVSYYVFLYNINKLNYESAMREAYSFSKGYDVKKVRALMKECYDKKIRNLIRKDIRDIMEQHKKKKRIIILATNSWQPMVKDLATELEAGILISTKVKKENGKYTGVIDRACYGEKKALHVKDIAKKLNIDLSKSYAYTDHISDSPLLETVGNPVATYPDRKLEKLAKEKKWKMIK